MPPTMIRPATMSTTLKAKRRCCNSFFITDILGNCSRSTSPTSANANRTNLRKNTVKNSESDDDDDPMLHDSGDDDGKKTNLSGKFLITYHDLSDDE